MSLAVLVGAALGQVQKGPGGGIVYAQGGIEVDFTSDNWPFFETNFMPGDVAKKEVTVRNASSQTQRVGMRMDNGKGVVLAAPLFIKVSDKNTGKVYFGKWLGRSLLETYFRPEVKLFDLKRGQEKRLVVEIKFLPESSNDFQGKETRFDFSLGFIGRRPQPSLPTPPLWPFPWPFPGF